MIKRNQPIWDAIRFKKIGKNGNIEYFQIPSGGTATTIEDTPVNYIKTEYYTNNKLAGITEQGQILKIKGIGVYADTTNPELLEILLAGQPVLEFIVKDQVVFKLPIWQLIKYQIGFAGQTSGSTYASKIYINGYYNLEDMGIVVNSQEAFKVKITFYNDADLNTYTNIFVVLNCIEERN